MSRGKANQTFTFNQINWASKYFWILKKVEIHRTSDPAGHWILFIFFLLYCSVYIHVLAHYLFIYSTKPLLSNKQFEVIRSTKMKLNKTELRNCDLFNLCPIVSYRNSSDLHPTIFSGINMKNSSRPSYLAPSAPWAFYATTITGHESLPWTSSEDKSSLKNILAEPLSA